MQLPSNHQQILEIFNRIEVLSKAIKISEDLSLKSLNRDYLEKHLTKYKDDLNLLCKDEESKAYLTWLKLKH